MSLIFTKKIDIWHDSWLKKSNSKTNEYKLFLPERPNDSYECLLSIQMIVDAILKKKNTIHNDFMNHLNKQDIDICLNKLHNIINGFLLNDNHYDGEKKLIWSQCFIYWNILLYIIILIQCTTNNTEWNNYANKITNECMCNIYLFNLF